MSQQLPIKFTELAQLTNYDIRPESIAFNSTTLESDHFVCIRQTPSEGASPELIILDLQNNNSISKRSIKADNAILHWSRQIIALRAQSRTLQVFDLDKKAKLKSTTMNEDVVFWKWVSETTLGLVTSTSVYHWDVFDDSQASPVKVFERNQNLASSQIINYRVSHDGSWMVVVGISQPSPGSQVVGNMQLYSKARGISQAIEGHAAGFGTYRLEGASQDSKLFSFVVRSASGAKLHIVEVDFQPGNTAFTKRNVDVYFPAEAHNDFPVAMQISDKYKIIYMVTKFGFIHLYDLETGTCIFMNRISSDTIFTTCPDSQSAGLVGVNKKGQVLSVAVDENTIIPYLLQNPANTELAYKLASRAGLPGADALYQRRFDELINSGQYVEAAKVAANSPRGFLRTPQTIERFKSVPQPPNGLSVILQYFGMLLDQGSLNKYETLELVRPVLAQNRKHLLEKWLKEDKLECTEELGDIVRGQDLNLALGIYQKANAPQRVVASLAELGQYDKILPYSKQAGYQPDYIVLLQHLVRSNPDSAAQFASALAKDENGPLIDIERAFDIFASQNQIQQATSFLLDVLAANKPEQGHLQTRLLEMNLLNAPQVADAILGNDMFSHYDKPRIATLCEQAGLFTRALEHNDDPVAIKRIIVRTDKFPEEWLINYFGNLTPELSLDALDEMLKFNIRQNLQIVIRIAQKYSTELGPLRLISLLEKYKTAEGLYYYLGGIVNVTDDKDVVFKYIEAATRTGQLNEVERVCRENNVYDPEKVKNFLKEANLSEQLPLIIVCDRFNFVHDLILYLYKNQQFKSIEVFVQRINPSRTPGVVGGLLDVDCDENIIKNLLDSVTPTSVPIDELVSEVESRNRLKILLPFLEKTLAAGNQQQAVFNALAKIYIDSNNNPEKFLQENDQYDSLTVGKYCEKRDPNLAFISYRKGQNDLELINVTNENSMFKAQARYILERADLDVWKFVLADSNMYRRSLVDSVISTAVPESQDPEKVSIAVKAFVDGDLPAELIEMLERIILEPTTFSDNTTLQNLLLFTAAKADKGRVMNYVQQLDNYSPDDVASALNDQGMYDEAFEIYKKYNNHVEAVSVLVDHIVSIDRAQEYADRVDEPAVWSKVAKAQLTGLRVPDAIESYIKAQDPSNYMEVIETSTAAGKDEELVKFLKMARKTLREPPVDTALAFCFARLNLLAELEEFLRGPNVADVELSGDKAFEEGYHEASKIFFSSISNWAKLATTLVHLEDYQAAVECARKANSIKVWKQVHEACVEKKEFRLAQICGLNLIVHAEELSTLVRQYEYNGYFDELISLLEAGLGLERAHMGMFTELGIALTKYHPERVFEHIKIFWTRLNMPKMISATSDAHLWPELVFLYHHYEEFDNAVLAMMERSADAWDHNSLKEIIVKVANIEIYYRAVTFYRDEHANLLTDLLATLTPRIDVNRVVTIFQKSDDIPLIKTWLINVQHQNKRTVNNAIHEILIEEEDYKTLRDSVNAYDNYDAQDLAQRLEKHDLVFFRQIAANIWRKSKRWQKSIELSKQDKLYRDAIETAALSGKSEVVEELLRYFVDIGSRECYVGMLYSCYELLKPDVVLEFSWRNGLHDFTMPYLINLISNQTATIDLLKKDNEERKAREASQQKEDDNTPILGGSRLLLTQGPNGVVNSNATGYRGY